MLLPISEHREAIVASVVANQVTIIVGETGSGKTTAVPQYLYEAGLGRGGMIGITEPRRVAATSVAKYVASNLGVEVGTTVAHKIRFNDATSPQTSIKFMTDGILLREFHDDPLLSQYMVIMVDEAHERGANIDFVLGLLKDLLVKRPELRVVVASATIDADKFSRYFGGAPVIQVDGRLHHVEVVWAKQNLSECVPAVVETIERILTTTDRGDILAFLTGVDEIDAATDAMEYLREPHGLVVLPAHGRLSPEEQSAIFKAYPGKRKVVLATNVAETSITIDGIVFVIDSGLIKQTHFDPSVGIQSLDVVEHSKAGCEQRAGRAGRTQPGVCYRLFTRENFADRPEFTEPEIKRMSLAGVVLSMEALEIPEIENFDFIDAPDAHAFHEAYDTLQALGAIKKGEAGLTPIGVEMAALPLDPRTSRMVIEARKYDCVEDVVTIAAFMSGGRSVFARPRDKMYQADRAHATFKSGRSDALTYLRVWEAYKGTNCSRDWCFEKFLMVKTLQEIGAIRKQLLEQLSRSGVAITHSGDDDAVLRSVAAGLSYNLLRHATRYEFVGVQRELEGVFIHPSSSLFTQGTTAWMVAAEVVTTSRNYARMCSQVKPAWLPEIAPTSFMLGEPVLHSYTPGDLEVTASAPVLYKNKQYGSLDPVGETEVKVSLERAQAIQAASIRKGLQEGWVLLTAERGRDIYGWVVFGRSASGRLYRISSMGLETRTGEQVFCRVSEGMGGSPGFALGQMRVLPLPAPKPSKPTDDKPTVREMVTRHRSDVGTGSLGVILMQAVSSGSRA